jgi:hypothetical protein
MYFDFCPAQISELYHADMVGNTTPRLISIAVSFSGWLCPLQYKKNK